MLSRRIGLETFCEFCICYVSELLVRHKEKAIMETSVNRKYVNLLQSTFEKFKSLDRLRSVEAESPGI